MSLQAALAVDLGDLALDVSLTAAPGEVVAVLGPNAAGKSTVLRCLAGLLPIRQGRIELDGRVLDEPSTATFVPPENRSIGVMFQDDLLFPHLDVRDNIAYGVAGTRRAARSAAQQLLDAHGLSELAGARVDALSGGQAQRVALLRALAARPSLLLLDEPLAALDAQTRAAVRRELRETLAEFDGVRILVTHDPVDAFALADRLVILEDGSITDEGTPADIAARPRTEYAAELVGTNLVRGTAAGNEVTTGSGGRLVTATHALGPVLVVIAPAAVSLHGHRPDGSPRNVWEGTVTHLDRRVDRVHVHVDGPVPLVADVTPAAVEALALSPGTPIWVAVKATELAVHPV
jgi:molybdate transport system ATP-binding protein